MRKKSALRAERLKRIEDAVQDRGDLFRRRTSFLEATGSTIVLNIFRLQIDLVKILVRARTPRLLG